MRVLITGASGFVGHHIMEHFLKNTDWHIVVLDSLDYASSGFDRLRDTKSFNDERVKVFTWDLCVEIPNNLKKEIGQVDLIIHMAAGSSVDESIKTPVSFVQNNINSTLNILEYAKTIPNSKFIYFSTDEVYGTAPEGVNYKEGARFNPGNPYAASKAASECICYAYANTYKLPIIITNTMNVIGERQHPEKYLPKVINCILNHQKLTIHADKTKIQPGKRHYIHARNVADALLFIINHTNETLNNIDASMGKFNIVGETELDNLRFAQLILNAVNKATDENYTLDYELVDFHSSRPGHDLRYSLDSHKLRALGWNPPMKVEETINTIVAWSLKPENVRWLTLK